MSQPVSHPASEPSASAGAASTVSTHVLDTAAGRPAADVAVTVSVRSEPADAEPADGGQGEGDWLHHAVARTDADGRCTSLPPLPPGATHAQLCFATGPYLRQRSGAGFFPEVTVTFAVAAGEHHHVPLLLSPFGYSVYRGS